MSSAASSLVSKVWNYCNLLRDDGVSYGDYVEQLTYLLFLKMAHERTQPPWNRQSAVPIGYDWPSLTARHRDDLEAHYRRLLAPLGRTPGPPGVILRNPQNKPQAPGTPPRRLAGPARRSGGTRRPGVPLLGAGGMRPTRGPSCVSRRSPRPAKRATLWGCDLRHSRVSPGTSTRASPAIERSERARHLGGLPTRPQLTPRWCQAGIAGTQPGPGSRVGDTCLLWWPARIARLDADNGFQCAL